MTNEEIIRLTRESGMSFILGHPHQKVVEQLGRFAALVAVAERDACVNLCEKYNYGQAPKIIADAIRARGNA